MKIAIMSDSHDNFKNLEQAIAIANKSCEMLLFAGDFIAPPLLLTLSKFRGPIKFVWGNNDGEKVGLMRKSQEFSNIEITGDIFDGTIGKLRFFMNHYPNISNLAFKTNDYDVCINGHTHIYSVEESPHSILINPGEIQGFITGNATFAILDTDTKKVEKIEL